MNVPACARCFLASRSGRGFVLYLVLCVVVSAAVGYEFQRRSWRWFEASKSEEKVTVLALVEAFVEHYSQVRGAYLPQAPVPATFRAHGIERVNRGRDGETALRLLTVGPPGRAIATPPRDPMMAETIRRFADQDHPEPEHRLVEVEGRPVLRTMFPSVAREQTCVDCHNRHQPLGPAWRLNEVMGALAVDVPAGPFLAQTRREAAMIALSLFALSAAVGLYIFVLQFRQLAAEQEKSDHLRAARDAAQAADRTKSILLGKMSHELRTPLNAIIGFSEVIRDRLLGGEALDQYADFAREIKAGGQHLLTVLNDIIDMARIEAGLCELHEQEIDIGDAVQGCAAAAAKAQAAALALSVAPAVQPLRAA